MGGRGLGKSLSQAQAGSVSKLPGGRELGMSPQVRPGMGRGYKREHWPAVEPEVNIPPYKPVLATGALCLV